jgi:hypothetical protein
MSCPENFDPICGSDGKTYKNMCFFQDAATSNLTLRMDSKGACGK